MGNKLFEKDIMLPDNRSAAPQPESLDALRASTVQTISSYINPPNPRSPTHIESIWDAVERQFNGAITEKLSGQSGKGPSDGDILNIQSLLPGDFSGDVGQDQDKRRNASHVAVAVRKYFEFAMGDVVQKYEKTSLPNKILVAKVKSLLSIVGPTDEYNEKMQQESTLLAEMVKAFMEHAGLNEDDAHQYADNYAKLLKDESRAIYAKMQVRSGKDRFSS